MLPDAEHARMKPEYAGMAVWPRPGSVRLVDGVVLVKLGRCEPAPGGVVCEQRLARRLASTRSAAAPCPAEVRRPRAARPNRLAAAG